MYDVVFIQYFISGFYNRILEIDDCTWLQKDMLPVLLSNRVYNLFRPLIKEIDDHLLSTQILSKTHWTGNK